MTNESIRTLILTSDPGNWCLAPMAYLWNKYVGSDYSVTVCGFSEPNFELPKNFEFVSLGKFEEYPANLWGYALRKAVLNYTAGDPFLFLLEDFWPVRHVDKKALNLLYRYLRDNKKNSDVLRIDLTADRLNATGVDGIFTAKDVDTLAHLDIIESVPPTQYLMSTMAGLWRPELLLHMIEGMESPWEFEIQGTQRVADSGYRVLGTRQFPFRHTIAVQRGKMDLQAGWMRPPAPVHPKDIHEMIEAKIIPPEKFR